MQVTKRVATLLLAVLLLCTSTVFPIWGYALDTGQETTVTEVTTTTDAEDATEAPTAEATTTATNATENSTESTEASTEETTETTEATTEPATEETTGATTDATEATTEPETEDITEVTNSPVVTDNAETIWNYLYDYFGNACAAAGVMGNMWAESGLNPTNMENAYEGTYTDETYTAAIDSGEYTGFASDGIGYGLVQWTYSEYKQSLYEYAQEQKTSIGSLTMQLDFLLEQMDTIKTTMRDNLMAATTVSQASNLFLIGMENESADDEVKQERAGYGSFYYSYGQSLIAAATEPTTDETEPEMEAAAEAADPSAVTECNPTELTATLDDGSTVSLYSPATVINGKATLTAATFEPDDEYMEVLLESFGIENVLGYECIELTLSPSLSLVTVTLTFPEDLVPSLNDTDTCHVLVEMDDEVSAADAEFTVTDNSLVKATFELESMSESVRLYVLTSDEASETGSTNSNTFGYSNSGSFSTMTGGTLNGDMFYESFVGVTMQVVYYRYADCYNKTNSYNCVINTVKNPSSGAYAWDSSGSYTSSTKKLSTVYDMDSYNPTGTFIVWGMDPTTIHCGFSVVNNLNADSDVRDFIYHIIMGTGYGSWNTKSVGTTDSTYTKVLQLLGASETAINNYLSAYNEDLDPTDEANGNLLIPTIIWSFICGDRRSSGIAYSTMSYLNSKINHNVAGAGGSILSAYSSGSAITEIASYGCSIRWNDATNTTIITDCDNVALGIHNQNGSNCAVASTDVNILGKGLVNGIQADGVDSTSRYYFFRGYWTPFEQESDTQTITVTKVSSADADCQAQIEDNDLYSLEGAVYGIYTDSACTNLSEKVTTGSDGSVKTSKKYKVGSTFYIKEITAPPGYKLSDTVYSIKVTATASKNTVPVADEPVFDPPVAMTKIDKDTTNPQGNTNFEGAIFKFEYFANDSWSGTATRTWYFKTNASGYAIYGKDYLADGYTSDALYVDTDGAYSIPLGTVRITEVVNSLGYTVLSSSLEASIVYDSSSSTGIKWSFTTASAALYKEIATGNYGVYEPIDAATFGSVTVTKIDSENTTAQGSATLQGAVFEIVNNSTNSVKIGSNAEAEPGEVCMTITTNASGVATSGAVLPIGSYTIREKSAPTGYLLNSTWSKSFTITSAEAFNYTTGSDRCSEDVIRGGLKIIKQNDLDGSNTGADAMLDNITFAVISENANPVVVNGKTYTKGQTVLTLTPKWDGTAWTASTANDALPYGTYTVKEVAMSGNSALANSYYLLNTATQTLTVTSNGTVYTQTWQNTLRPGEIKITKVNSHGEKLAGAKFLLQWRQYDTDTWQNVTKATVTQKGGCTSVSLADGTLTTDSTGVITFSGLDPRMQYRVTELEAPEGYQLLSDYAYVGLLNTETASIELNVVNNTTYDLPHAGSNSLLLLPLLAAPLFAMAFAMVYTMARRKVRR